MRLRGLLSGVLLAMTMMAGPAVAQAAPAGHGSLLPLVTAAADRVRVADLVAAAKFPDQPITDPVREQQVLDFAAGRARELGIDPDAAVAFFRDQIEAAKVVEYGLFSRWTAHPEQAPTTKPDLPGEVRPMIDKLNEQLITGLADTVATRASAGCPYRLPVVVRATGVAHGFDHLHAEGLSRAIRNVCTGASATR
jgi:chorismate mutase